MGFEYSTPAIARWNLDDLMEIIDDFEDAIADRVYHKMSINNDW